MTRIKFGSRLFLLLILIATFSLSAGMIAAQEGDSPAGVLGSTSFVGATGAQPAFDPNAPQTVNEFHRLAINGDVTSAGVGMRSESNGEIQITAVPQGASVARAFLYWNVIGYLPDADIRYMSVNFNDQAVVGELIGTTEGTCWGFDTYEINRVYRADVTQWVTGNGGYRLRDFPNDERYPAALQAGENETQGASLVVVYQSPSMPLRNIIIHDGADSITATDSISDPLIRTTFDGFVIGGNRDARLHLIVADGQHLDEPNSTSNADDGEISFGGHALGEGDLFEGVSNRDYRSNSARPLWDDVTINVADLNVTAPAEFRIDQSRYGSDCLLLVAAVFSHSLTPTAPPVAATATPTATQTHTPTVTPTATTTATGTPPAQCVVVSRVTIALHESDPMLTETYIVTLSEAPILGENITVMPLFDTAQINVLPTHHVLDSTNWNTGAIFTAYVIDDAEIETDPHFTPILHIASSNVGGSVWNNVTGCQMITVGIYDNDTGTPTETPTETPTLEPTEEPTAEPTIEPTEEPTAEPTVEPTEEPTAEPTIEPTEEPTAEPTIEPTEEPTVEPTITATPTDLPSVHCVVSSRSGVVLYESLPGLAYAYTVTLNQAPAAGESVTVIPVYDSSQVSITPASRTLNAATWSTGATFTISVIADAVPEAEAHVTFINHVTNSSIGSPDWTGASGCARIQATIYDAGVLPTATPTATATEDAGATPTPTVESGTPAAPTATNTVDPALPTATATPLPF